MIECPPFESTTEECGTVSVKVRSSNAPYLAQKVAQKLTRERNSFKN